MNLTDWQSQEAQRRERLCLRAEQLLAESVSLNECSRILEEPIANLHRFLKAHRAGGFDALVPQQAGNSGKKSASERLSNAVGPDQFAAITKRVAAMALDTESDGLAWRAVAREPGTPEPIRDYFAHGARRSKHSIAPSLKAAIHTGPLTHAKHRGNRTYGLKGPYQPRELDILPGDIFTSDDTTPIWAWWVPWPKSKEYPYGAKLLQGQWLPVPDVASQHILSHALIARERASYRASDIWRLMGWTHANVGLPRLGWQKERGSWEAGIIDGVRTEAEENEPSHAQRVGGLRMLPSNLLPFHVDKMGEEKARAFRTLKTWTSYLPKSKSVEGIFHRVQKFEGTLWGVLGRSQQRRPYEKSKKLYEMCKAGKADPRLNFLSATELVNRLNACIEAHEAECMEGEVFRGVPPETWERGLADHGPLLAEPPDQAWLMTSDWALVTARQGMARIRRTDEASGANVSYHYHHPDFCGPLDGKQVLVYFNRDEFEQPAHVLVPRGKSQPEYLGQAEYIERRGMFLDDEIGGYELRKRQSGIVTTIYTTLAPHIPSRQLPAEIAARRTAADASRHAGEVIAIETRMPGGNVRSSSNQSLSPATATRGAAIDGADAGVRPAVAGENLSTSGESDGNGAQGEPATRVDEYPFMQHPSRSGISNLKSQISDDEAALQSMEAANRARAALGDILTL